MSKKIYIKIDKPIEVGDLVRCVGDTFWFQTGDIRKVCSLDGDQLSLMGDASLEVLTKYWEPVRKEVRENENHRSDMKREIADMIVELLDKEDKENCPQSAVSIFNWRDLDNTVTASDNVNKSHTATLSPNDTWDTLTGVYVALSKATGRKLPDWIYGRETR